MTEKQCSKCTSIKAMEHFEKEGNDKHVKTCIVCRRPRQKHCDNYKDDINRKKTEERACNGPINVNVVQYIYIYIYIIVKP